MCPPYLKGKCTKSRELNDWPEMIETALRTPSLVLTDYSPTRKEGRY